MSYTFYKIVCLDNSIDLCYVGSTCNFIKRKNSHKNACCNKNHHNYNYKLYTLIRENGGWDNFKFILISNNESKTKREAEKIEENYRQELNANLNSKRCYITEDEKENYYFRNKEKILRHQKKYREANRDLIIQKSKDYREANRALINVKAKLNKDVNNQKAREKYKLNKVAINEKARERREKNKLNKLNEINEIK